MRGPVTRLRWRRLNRRVRVARAARTAHTDPAAWAELGYDIAAEFDRLGPDPVFAEAARRVRVRAARWAEAAQ